MSDRAVAELKVNLCDSSMTGGRVSDVNAGIMRMLEEVYL